MNSPTLIIIPSFGTNRLILSGLIECVKDYFNVVFIDLPGTLPEVPPLEKVEFKDLTDYVISEINKLNISHFYVCGISFGFYIAGKIGSLKECKGIIAVSPFLTTDSMNVPPFSRKVCYWCGLFGARTGFHDFVWRNKALLRLVDKVTNFPSGVFDEIVKTYDPRTFFEYIRLIFGTYQPNKLDSNSIVLVINKHDKTIRYEYTVEQLKNGAKKLLEIDTKLEHFPKDLTSHHFKNIFGPENVKKILEFFDRSQV